MKPFMDEDFLLTTETAKTLYHKYAEGKPIVDFHNHLSIKEIYEDKSYADLAEVWLGTDHYKWRAMRGNGIPEAYVTGGTEKAAGKPFPAASPTPEGPVTDAAIPDAYARYEAWAATVPELFGNPLYHWTMLELKRYFDIDEPLSPANAKEVWETCNEKLKTKAYTARELLVRMNVKELCTTDDPADDLKYHKALKEEEHRFTARPTFRPEAAMAIEKEGFTAYIDRLSAAAGIPIDSYEALKEALKSRIVYFAEAGCRISDHSLEGSLYQPAEPQEIEKIFRRRISGEAIPKEDVTKYRGALLIDLAKEYHKVGWAMQLHIGALRNNSTRMFALLGADSGFDCEDDMTYAAQLSALLNEADKTGELPKTILYNLNPRDIEMLGAMLGNFQDGTVPGKIQLGAAWWFCDHKSGIERQLRTLSEYGVFSRFVGMVTDSRSFLSFPRHEYFRRILCNYVGGLVEAGEYPWDEAFLGNMIENICYKNAMNYLELQNSKE